MQIVCDGLTVILGWKMGRMENEKKAAVERIVMITTILQATFSNLALTFSYPIILLLTYIAIS